MKNLDPAEVERMATAGASNVMIADALGVDETTIRRGFPEIVKKARALRRIALLELQWESAKKGNPALLIWLGKNELGQSDTPEVVDEKPAIAELKIVRPGTAQLLGT